MPFEQSIPSNQSVKRQIQNVRDGDEAMYAGQTFAFSPGSYFASGYAGELDKAIFGHFFSVRTFENCSQNGNAG